MSEMMHTGNEPLPEEWTESYRDQEQGADQWAEMQPVPVEVKNVQSENVAPESTGLMFYNIATVAAVAGTGSLQPTQVCPHRYRRYKAKFLFTVPASTTIYVSRVPDRLMSNALGTTYQITVGATAITTSQALMPDYDGQQPLYMVATNPGATVSVMDESYNTVQ